MLKVAVLDDYQNIFSQIINIDDYKLPNALISIDGGIARETSIAYQFINDFSTRLGLIGIKNIQPHMPFTDALIYGVKKSYQKMTRNVGGKILIPIPNGFRTDPERIPNGSALNRN